MTWNYSHTLLLPGDEVSNPVELSNGSVILDMRGHDLRSYDQGDPNNAMRWLGRSDDGGTQWPRGRAHIRPFVNGSSTPAGQPMHFGGDCFGDMTSVIVGAHCRGCSPGDTLVMGAIHRDGQGGGISGRSDYRVHKSVDGGSTWTLVAQVYSGSVSYSGIRAVNSTHVGVMINAGPMACGAHTKYVVVKFS